MAPLLSYFVLQSNQITDGLFSYNIKSNGFFKNTSSQDFNKKSCFTVIKIDSILIKEGSFSYAVDGIYIISAKRNEKIYRITSVINRGPHKRCISIGECYAFSPVSHFYQDPKSSIDLELAQSNMLTINGIHIKRDEEGAADIFYDESLENLCFKNK